MKVLRNRLLVTLIFAAVVLTFGSSAALAAFRTSVTAGATSVSQVDRPTATPTSGEPDVGGAGATAPTQKGLRPVVIWDDPQGGTWWTWISRIWASWSPTEVR